MRNSRLLPYETIVQATSGEPEAVNLVLQHYRGYIRYAARISGQADQDAEDYITETLLKAIFKFRMDRVSPRSQLNNRRHAAAHRAGNQKKVSCFFCALRLPESPFLITYAEQGRKNFLFHLAFLENPCITRRKGQVTFGKFDFPVVWGLKEKSGNLRHFCFVRCCR